LENAMKRLLSLFGVMVLAAFLVAGCDKEDTNTGVGPGDGGGTGGVPAEIVIARTFPALLANGVDQIEVKATVVDGQGRGLENVGVLFTTNRGSIEPFATTDDDGVATTTFTSEASATDVSATVVATALSDSGDARARLVPLGVDAPRTLKALPAGAVVVVTHRALTPAQAAEAGRLQAEGRLAPPTTLAPAVDPEDQAAIPMKGITVSVSANPGTIPADGISSSQVVARLVETTSRIPVRRQDVSFGATAGSINGLVQTDDTGSATATLTGLASGAASTVTVYYGRTLTAQTTVTFSALTLSVAPALSSIRADGQSTVDVVARLINAERNPVQGARIDFTTNRGTIVSPVTTDASGEARATLRSNTQTGAAQVTASFGALSQQTTVNFVALPVVGSILMEAETANLDADGADRTTITATVLDAANAPMPDGTPVTFSISGGSGSLISPEAVTTDGEAEVTYVASTTPGVVTIRATSGPVTGTLRLTLGSLEPGSLALTAGSPTVLADGLASTTLAAQVSDAFGNPVAAGTVVDFTTTLGAIEAVTPTDAAGIATARIRPNRFETGLARVTAASGEALRSIDVRFVSDAADHIVMVELDRPRIGIIGTGSPQTATFTMEVRDRYGIPVDADHAVTVNFTIVPTGGATDATLAVSSAQTNERGRVAAVVRAGTDAGVVEVRANVGGIVSAPIRVAVHGDLPDAEHFSIAFERVNIAGLVYDGLRNGVTAHVGDALGNPVPDSTAVWFTANYGLIQGSAFTDAHAEATVWEITAAPRPSEGGSDGLVQITAQTIAKDGSYITTSGNVMWSGHTILEITSPVGPFAIPNGGSLTVQFRVRDANNNPLVGGTTIAAAATVGEVGGDNAVELPDTQDDAYTFFSVTLSDDDSAEAAPPVGTTLTITVASPNGNATASISGTID
jgi:hypothetical protein